MTALDRRRPIWTVADDTQDDSRKWPCLPCAKRGVGGARLSGREAASISLWRFGDAASRKLVSVSPDVIAGVDCNAVGSSFSEPGVLASGGKRE
jgi:hypothetical protein